MNHCCGWVELVGEGSRRTRTAMARISRVRHLVEDGAGPGWTAAIDEADGRWHVWITGVPGGGTAGMLPFFKAVGSLVPAACGVLDLAGPTRWVMTGGSVDLARHPERTPVGGVTG